MLNESQNIMTTQNQFPKKVRAYYFPVNFKNQRYYTGNKKIDNKPKYFVEWTVENDDQYEKFYIQHNREYTEITEIKL